MSIEAFRRAYAPERIGRPFGFRDRAYSKHRDHLGRGIHRGLDVREQNAAATASVVTDVIAITSGTVVYVGRPNTLLQLTVVIDRGWGVFPRYESHSHMADVAVSRGDEVRTGDRLGRNARLNERPGLISGVHDHITFTNHSDGAWNLSRDEFDPYPVIQDHLASTASGGATPFDPENSTRPKEWDEMASKEEMAEVVRDELTKAFGANLRTFALIPLKNGEVYIQSLVTGRHVHVREIGHVGILRRAAVNNGDDVMLESEMRTVQGYLASINGNGLTAFALIPATDGRVYVVSLTTGRRMHVISPSHLDLLRRVASNDVTDTMLTSQIDLVQGYLTAISTPVDVQVDLDKLAERLAEIGQGVSEADVKRAVSDALRETIPQIKVTI